MTKAIEKTQSEAHSVPEIKEHIEESSASFVGKFVEDYILDANIWTALTCCNLIFAYIILFCIFHGYKMGVTVLAMYIPLIFVVDLKRKSRKEKTRLAIAHRIPYFADAIANSLSAGATLEQAFKQGSYFLIGKIKTDFNQLILKNTLGGNLGALLRELDSKYPNTGLMYLISLLDAYSELGVGVSPLLKRISVVLNEKEKAEDKIRTILAGGSSYANLTVGVFAIIFFVLSYLMKEQVKELFSPSLKPWLVFLCSWTILGILIVTRVTSLGFVRNFALKPFIKTFVQTRKLSLEDLFTYSGLRWNKRKRQLLYCAPLLIGFLASYVISWFSHGIVIIEIGFALGTYIGWKFIKLILNGMVEEQLIKTTETFPEILQVFIIGLNAGLNAYLSFQFALNAMKGEAPRVLAEELRRTKLAMECGEEYARTWHRLADRLPFETVIDFAKIMVIAPLHGESITNSINQMINGYQEKKMLLIEKKAVALSQGVVPIIVMAFLPLFLFVLLAPLLSKISILIHMQG